MKLVISGSFRKFYGDIFNTIAVFEQRGLTVLSPLGSKIINPGEEFVLLETDNGSDVKQIEDKHLGAIAQCDFLYVVNPGGYIGASTALEIGYANALNKPVYSSGIPSDVVLRRYIAGKFSPGELLTFIKK